MAKYTTTTEELTSIADAIREKTGETSSLIYPTGFVSAINSLNISNTSLDQSLYHLTLLDNSFSLDSTNFNTWTPSTTVTNLTTSVRREDLKFYRDLSNRAGRLKLDYSVQFVYKNEIPSLGGVWFGTTYIQYIIPRCDTPNDMLTKNKSYINAMNNIFQVLLLYKQNNGNIASTMNNLGIMISYQGPSLSNNSTPSNLGITINTPIIRAQGHNSYFAPSALEELDAENTILKYKLTYDEYEQTTVSDDIYDSIYSMYIADYT